MISHRLLFALSILVIPHLLFSQEESNFNNSMALASTINSDLRSPLTASNIDFSLRNDRSFPVEFTDTLGVKSFEVKSAQNQIVHPQWLKAAIVPAALVVAGAITLVPASHCLLSKYTIHNKVVDLFPGFHSSLDNYMQYAPLAAVFGLKAAGVKSRSDFVNQVAISAKAELLMTVITSGMKHWISSERPSGSGMNSMPSGHTAQAFLSATILDMEYRDTSPWISVSGYTVATTTAVFRMANNQHWISDVLIGAGIGIFSTKAVYFTHRYRWGKKSNVVILPTIYKNGGGVSFGMLL